MKLPKKQSVTSRVLIALTLTVAGIAGFSGMAEAATCFSCHAPAGQTADLRPVESTFRNITTGGFKGSHAKHIPATTTVADCNTCHGAAVTSYDTKHRDGFINVTTATTTSLGYSKGASFPQQGNQALALGSCSTASCHANPYGAGTVATPVWGDSAANCTACHTTPIGATGPATGSHATTTAHAVDCTTCHAAGTSATTAPSAVNGHNDGNIDVANVGYPVDKAKGSAATTCSTASCHVNVYGAGSVATPVWGTSASCNACHTVAIDVTGPATGSHVAHNNSTCTDCHAAGTTQITKPSTGHADGDVTVTNGYPVTAKHAAGSYSGTCSTASCHADPYSAGQVATPVWGTAAGCAACHTGVNVITATGPATGSHAKHAVACTSCHNAGTSATTKPDTAHATGFIDVVGVGYPASKAKGSIATTCSAASCHADPYSAGTVVTPVWGTAAGCVACHTGAGEITANGPATGSHTNVASHAVACTSCHADGTSATTAPTFANGHADGNIDVVAVGYPINKVKGSAKVSCSTASCHVDPYSDGLVTTPVWGSTGNGCAACHTTLITANGPATGNHTNVTAHAVACTTCHAAGTTATSAPSTGHVDGNIDVVAVGYPIDKVKGSAKVSCSTASCHADPYSAGSVVTPVWGTTGNGCAACHTTLITANGPATGSHTNVASHAVACTTCHAVGTTATTAPTFANGHNDGNIDVANVGYPLDKEKGSAKASCSTTACHGSTSPVWGASTTNDTCTKCHGTGTATVTAANEFVVAPTDASATDTGKVSSLAKVGAHQTHLQLFNGLSQQGADAKARCEVCHTLPTVGTHANGSSVPVFSGIATGGSYNAGTCSVSCHNPAGSTLLAAGNAGTAITPSWTDANYIADGVLKTQANCGTCHKSPGDAGFTASLSHDATAMPLGIGTDCSACHGHNGGTGGIVGQQHMDGTKWGNGACDACHGYPPVADMTGRGVVGNYENAKMEKYNGGGGHHTTHLLATVKSSDGFTPCLPCHPSGFHNQGNGTVAKANINVNDAADLTFRFDDSRAKRYNVATQSCSNVSCHYQPTPAWTFGL